MDLTETFRKIRPACVAIALLREDSSHVKFTTFGSGVCVDARGYLLIAKHVVTYYYEGIKGESVSPDRAPSKAEFVAVFSQRTETKFLARYVQPINIWLTDSDIAMLRIPEIPGGWPSIDLPREWHTWEGASVAAAGYPQRDRIGEDITPNLFHGIVSQINGHYVDGKGFKVDKLVLDMSIHPGNSGGPVFDASTGELIGIVSSHTLTDLVRAKGKAGEPPPESEADEFSVSMD